MDKGASSGVPANEAPANGKENRNGEYAMADRLRRAEARFRSLCRLSRFLETTPMEPEAVFQRAADIISEGFGGGDPAPVRIRYGGLTFDASGFSERPSFSKSPSEEVVKIVNREECFGVIERHRRRPPAGIEQAPGPDDREFMEAAAGRLGAFVQRIRTEESLKMERRQLLSIFDSIGEPIYVADPETHDLLFINDALRRIFGKVEGRKCYQVLQHQEAPCGFCNNSEIFGLNLGRSSVWEHCNPSNDRWYRCIDRAIRWSDGRMVRCEIAFDISDLKRAEAGLEAARRDLENRVVRRTEALDAVKRQLEAHKAYLTSVLDTMQAGVLVIDPATHRIVDVNRHAAVLTGYEKEEMIGEICHRFVCPSDRGQCPVTDHEKIIDNAERELLTADGGRLPILKSAVAVSKGKIPYLVESFVDISDIKALVREQEMDIATAKRIMSLTNGPMPRRVELSDDRLLVCAEIDLPCHQEGGDHFFVRERPRKTEFSLKDQSGHKVGCILRSILTDGLQHRIREERPGEELEGIVWRLNNEILREGYFGEKDFATAVVGEIDHQSLETRFVVCGHSRFIGIRGGTAFPLPLRRDKGGGNMAIGMLPNVPFRSHRLRLMTGDGLILYTDGLADPLRNPESRLSAHDRILKIVQEIIDGGGGVAVPAIMGELVRRVAGISGRPIDPSGINGTGDDITLLGLQIESRRSYRKEVWHPADLRDLQSRLNRFLAFRRTEWERAGFEDPVRLRYALSEAVVNGWKHGNRCDPLKPIEVRYRYNGDFVVEVQDAGEGFDPGRITDPALNGHLLSGSGRGLKIIGRYADFYRFNEAGNRLMLTFDRAAPTRPGDREG